MTDQKYKRRFGVALLALAFAFLVVNWTAGNSGRAGAQELKTRALGGSFMGK